MKHELKTVRVYELAPETAGYRILIDRLWPRGLRKEALMPFFWAKELAPSNELRKWFGHIPERFPEFSERYRAELAENPRAEEIAETIRGLLAEQDVLLLYAAKNKEKNHAAVLKDWLLYDALSPGRPL
ncbi:DUF488 domain-containing protein [Lachnoclostridium sp. Marseille-P6806]|uniref:DUF488 domain-containing protein n=1 Tax=Lachnoclostridium sp. Marseille-P6806 TaxID=2364793 RepID=UPI00102FC8DD|nr:DUF488 family protein [Lachnoclostridium sp. Marseille-P6806]